MMVSELKKKFPVIRGRDHGEKLTVGEIVEMLAKALDARASEDSVKDVAADVLDRDFLFGAWGDHWEDRDYNLLRDLRGLIIAAYQAGKKRAHVS